MVKYTLHNIIYYSLPIDSITEHIIYYKFKLQNIISIIHESTLENIIINFIKYIIIYELRLIL